MTKTIVLILACGLCIFALPAISQTQGRTTAPATVNPREGKFQLITDTQGAVFLVDTAEGRVWRYTKLTGALPPEAEIAKYLDRLIAGDEAELGRRYTEQERIARRNLLRDQRKKEIEAMANPCNGLDSCFLEVDRLRLTASGWTSEVIKK